MADLSLAERLQPSLLDRLTDDRRDLRHESRDDWLIDMRRLRDIVLRDLSWLINTPNSGIDFTGFPHAARSTLNYGLEGISGLSTGAARAASLREAILSAIEIYEPRLKSGTLDVQISEGETMRSSELTYDIRADLWAQPLPAELYLRTRVDVTTGEASVTRSG